MLGAQDMIDRMQNLIDTQDEYIKLLDAELQDLVPMAYNHGWRTQRAEEGERLRKKIADLKGDALK